MSVLDIDPYLSFLPPTQRGLRENVRAYGRTAKVSRSVYQVRQNPGWVRTLL